jgi:hypothetical protein
MEKEVRVFAGEWADERSVMEQSLMVAERSLAVIERYVRHSAVRFTGRSMG